MTSLSPYHRTLALLAAVCLAAGCAKKSDAARKAERGPQAAPVEVAAATRETVPLQVRAIGFVEPIQRVEVRAQVGGELLRVHFREGQDVRRGDLLFELDPRPAQQAVREAEAGVARAQAAVRQSEAEAERAAAEARNARSQYDRFDDLARKGIISRLQNEQYRTNADVAARAADASRATIGNSQAAVGEAEARLADARVQLGYTRLRAPISGRTGGLTVRQGNLLTANQTTPLVVINQVSPTYVTFSVPEQSLDEVRRFSAGTPLPVEAVPAQTREPPSRGTLTFIDNNVDEATGTIQIKGTFPNADRRLWPGQFVNVAVTLTQQDSVVVPTRAVQRGQEGDYLFVVGQDGTARLRRIQPARVFGDKTLIAKGVQAGERVITDGQVAVKPGGKVRIGNPRQGGETVADQNPREAETK